MVHLPAAGIRYLGTFACQGDLPLGLIGDTDNHVARYLQAVLKHTVEYGRFVKEHRGCKCLGRKYHLGPSRINTLSGDS